MSQPNDQKSHKSKNVAPGKKTGIKPTAKEHLKRVRQVADLLAQGWRTSQITEAICKEYGVHWNTVTNYLRQARELLLESEGKDRRQARGEAIGFYESIIRDPGASRRDKIKARERLDEIYGIDAPRRLEHSGPEGKPVQVEGVGKGIDMDHVHDFLRDYYSRTPAKLEAGRNGQQKT